MKRLMTLENMQVSITVTFKENEKEDVKRALKYFDHRLKAVSFLPEKDHGYEQAPYIPIDEETYLKTIEKINKFKIKDEVHDQVDKFCENDTCEIKEFEDMKDGK